jgi:uncharacterized repeat protein (TIGR02543 family)
VKVQQFTPQVEVGIEYDLGTADCSTTAVALIAQAMMDAEDYPDNLADINLTDIAADSDFNDVMSIVCSVIEAGEDPALSAVVQQAVEDFLYPPAPVPPPPTPTPPTTYTVTYDGNGHTAGTVPSDANNYEQGDSVTVLGNTGNLVKTQDGISLLFTGWNTAANGSGTSYNAADTFNMGNANVILYAQWSAITATGPAGGLIFYDKGSVSDGWQYLEAAPASTEETLKQWGKYGTEVGVTAQGTDVGTGKANTTAIVVKLNESPADSDRAAQLCDALTEGGYSDWFLPSKDELNLMYTNLHTNVLSLGGFESVLYWSSSEYNANFAYGQDFGGNLGDYGYKYYGLRVRAVRAFRSTAPTYIVNYNANEATGGTVPSDSYHYEPGETVTVLGNTGSLVKTDHDFAGWNTAADGSGTDQAEGSTFAMGASDVTLYAKWIVTISFDKNDAGAAGSMAAQTIASGSSANLTACAFTKTGWTFAGWATTPGGDVAYADEVSYTMGNANVTLYAKWTPPETYSIGDVGPAGGYIFYDKGSYSGSPSWRYLEAAPASTEWTDKQWGGYGTLIGGTTVDIGTGQSNTSLIVAWLDANTDDTQGDVTNKTQRAAYLCDDLTEGGYDDWFLPSKDELNLMYTNLHNIADPVGGFAGDYYWSSSEVHAYSVWFQSFGNGYQYSYYAENLTSRVRAVRAF